MTHPFDTVINRTGTDCLKYDFAVERGKPADVLPLWVADMDFCAPPAVIETLVKTAQHGIFGYTESKEAYFNALKNWNLQNYGWELQPSWLVKTPGVVYALCAAIRSLTKEGEAVLIQQPVYYPFSESILSNNRKLVDNSLVYKDGHYSIDFEDFEQKIIENQVKLFILCSPHNPVGRVWTKEELLKIGDICVKHNVYIVADEIHSDLIYAPNKHTPIASIKPEFAQCTITCTAPSKTFNLAGLQVSNIFISNETIRSQFCDEMTRTGYSQLNTMGLAACRSAYENGREWLENLKGYLAANLAFTRAFLKENLPQVHLVEPQGTYLIWLDLRDLNLTQEEMDTLIVDKAKLWLDDGAIFGKEGFGFQRINIACPRATLEKALTQLASAVQSL